MDGEWRTFRTPGGRDAEVWCRVGTNDAMVAEACITQDEYRTREIVALRVVDIGAHIGAWSVGYLLDHPVAQGILLEPLPDNIAVLTKNIARNGLQGRAHVVSGALSRDPVVAIGWNWRDADGAEMHRYIGGQRMPEGVKSDLIRVQGYTVASLLGHAGWPYADLCKVDCEGGEAALDGDPLGLIVGEFHVPRRVLEDAIGVTHDVAFFGEADFGDFRADPR
jgi:FkbM family methyltransferase